MNHFLKTFITTAALAVAGVASAAPVTLSDYEFSPGESVVKLTLTETDPITNVVKIIAGGPGAPAEYAGELQTGIVGGASFAAYCYDLTAELKLPNSYTPSSIELDNVARLFAVSGFSGDTWNVDGVSGGQTALQIAIWESKYDGLNSANLDSGNLSFQMISSSVKAQAISYLTAAAGLAAGSYVSEVRYFAPAEGAANQALVTTVPEPSTYALMAACLGVVGLVSRRKLS